MIKHVVAACIGSLFASPALAELEVCNEASKSVSLAIAYAEGDTWVSQGWWNIPAGSCQSPLQGNLKNRYYYYRATTFGSPLVSGDYMFCTSPDVFTIEGDTNCENRGYEQAGYASLDTGKKARSFTLTLRDPERAPKASPQKAPLQKNAPQTLSVAPPPPADVSPTGTVAPADSAAPGTFGEPYSEAAIMQGCIVEAERSCSFHASGTQFFVYEDWRTPKALFDLMQQLAPGTPILVEGDLVDIYDRTADVVLRNVTTRPWTTHDYLLNTLQGTWYSVEDPAARFNVLGAERDNSYDDAPTSRDYLTVSDWCDGFEGGGPYLQARDEETGDGACYSIERITDLELELMYLPRGNILQYRSLD